MDEQPKASCIEPGRVTQGEVTTSDRAYWHVRCPGCGQVHERNIHTYWDDGDEYGQIPRIVMHHYFVCMDRGVHYQIQSVEPFAVVMAVQFRETSRKQISGGNHNGKDGGNPAA